MINKPYSGAYFLVIDTEIEIHEETTAFWSFEEFSFIPQPP